MKYYGKISDNKDLVTKEWVNANGGKIDTISVNTVPQTVTDKNVDLTIHNVPSGGTSGQALIKTNNEDYALEWGNVDALPSQSGQSGKFLTTNGTTASWANPGGIPIVSVATGTIAIGNTTTTVNYTGTFVSAYALDIDNYQVAVDIQVNASTVVFVLNTAYINIVTCKVVFASGATTDGNTTRY